MKVKEYRAGTEPSEACIQADFFEWIDLNAPKYPELALFFAIPNEGNRSKLDGWKRKLTGRRAGVPDTHLPLPSNGKHGLWIEFKSRRGKVSDTQWQWITMLRCSGHQVEICRQWSDAASIVIDYLALDLQKP